MIAYTEQRTRQLTLQVGLVSRAKQDSPFDNNPYVTLDGPYQSVLRAHPHPLFPPFSCTDFRSEKRQLLGCLNLLLSPRSS